MQGKWVWAIVAFFIFIALGFAFFYTGNEKNNNSWRPITVNSENLPEQLANYQAINDLPQDSKVMLIIGKESYILKKGSVTKGVLDEPEITITLPESYFEIMGQYGWCSATAYANQNGDLGIQIKGSSASLAWKYRALVDYKKCLG